MALTMCAQQDAADGGRLAEAARRGRRRAARGGGEQLVGGHEQPRGGHGRHDEQERVSKGRRGERESGRRERRGGGKHDAHEGAATPLQSSSMGPRRSMGPKLPCASQQPTSRRRGLSAEDVATRLNPSGASGKRGEHVSEAPSKKKKGWPAPQDVATRAKALSDGAPAAPPEVERCWDCFEDLPSAGSWDWLGKGQAGERDRRGQPLKRFLQPGPHRNFPTRTSSKMYLMPLGDATTSTRPTAARLPFALSTCASCSSHSTRPSSVDATRRPSIWSVGSERLPNGLPCMGCMTTRAIQARSSLRSRDSPSLSQSCPSLSHCRECQVRMTLCVSMSRRHANHERRRPPSVGTGRGWRRAVAEYVVLYSCFENENEKQELRRATESDRLRGGRPRTSIRH